MFGMKSNLQVTESRFRPLNMIPTTIRAGFLFICRHSTCRSCDLQKLLCCNNFGLVRWRGTLANASTIRLTGRLIYNIIVCCNDSSGVTSFLQLPSLMLYTVLVVPEFFPLSQEIYSLQDRAGSTRLWLVTHTGTATDATRT